MDNNSNTDEYYTLWWLIFRVRDIMLRARQKELHQYRISAHRSSALYILKTAGSNTTTKEIARRLFKRPHTVSELLSRMEKDGLITKVKDHSRNNQIQACLTDKGLEAYYQSSKRESIRRMMSSISEEDHQHLMSALQILGQAALKELKLENDVPLLPNDNDS
jgi:DNA-binding MarR family transcriptional regulator